ncbi:MAG: nitrous oxide reductase accessory protein NosL [Lewinellaceae bacterium]|nr:nitrous oxide reductase accessory protein NosL [Lewinellaceae bacterium]
MFKITNISRITLVIGALALFIMLKTPIWSIYLTAPQYPEGLEMKIWHDTLTGDVRVISALNHYIGMRAISVDMFPEFEFIGPAIIGVGVLCLLLALIGRWWSALAYWVVLAIADSLALYDFWRWGYDYGHNLDPKAPIVIPGMAYQPPVLGYKKLLNFEAWSLPDTGGWILMGVTGISLLIVGYEWWRNRKHRVAVTKPAGAGIALLLPLFFVQCSTGPQPIHYGTDNCAFCKMTLMDKRYGAEIMTKKGKAFKFDDVNCLVLFEQEGTVKPEDVAGRYITDFAHEGVLLELEKALFLHSDNLKTPMASQVAAFATPDDLEKIKTQTGGETLAWKQVPVLFD